MSADVRWIYSLGAQSHVAAIRVSGVGRLLLSWLLWRQSVVELHLSHLRRR